MPKAVDKRSETEAVEAALDQVNRVIERRSRDEQQRDSEAKWDRTARAEAERLRMQREYDEMVQQCLSRLERAQRECGKRRQKQSLDMRGG